MPTVNKVRINEEFAYIDSRTYDKKHRLNLGKKVFNAYNKLTEFQEFMIYIGSQGDILLRPQFKLPARERWLIENPEAFETFQKGIKDVIEGRVTRVDDLDSFLDSL